MTGGRPGDSQRAPSASASDLGASPFWRRHQPPLSCDLLLNHASERVPGFNRGEPFGELADQGMEPHLVATELFHQAIVFELPQGFVQGRWSSAPSSLRTATLASNPSRSSV